MARLSGLKGQLLKRRRLLIGSAALALLIAVVRVEEGKLTWAEWTGFGSDVEETHTQEVQSNGTVTKTTISKKFQAGKTLWDGLSVLGVPFSLAILGYWLQQLQQEQAAESQRLQQEQASEEAKEEILQSYFDRISTLLIDKNVIAIAVKVHKAAELQKEGVDSSFEVTEEDKELVNASVDVIRARTLSILRRLGKDCERKGDVIRFLVETEIVSKLKLDLSNADLSNANLRNADLSNANLYRTNLMDANLLGANLLGANLSYADLSRTDLNYANLSYADLNHGNLSEANLSYAALFDADLTDATLTNTDLGNAYYNSLTKLPASIDPIDRGMVSL